MARALATAFAALLIAALAACQPRANPYRFRSPLVGSVSAADIERQPSGAREAESEPAPPRRRPLVAASEAIALEPPEVGASSGLADELRQLVGRRDGESSDVEFALDVLEEIGVGLDADLRGTTQSPDLLDIARARDATTDRPPLLGDLVVFEDVKAEKPSSLIGVVVSRDSRGTVELIHLSRGIVRRSFLNRRHPSRQRNGEGRVLNTFVRPGRPGDSPRTDYLGGELYETFIRLDRLTDSPRDGR